VSESRSRLVNFVFNVFESNILVDPQQHLLYGWQDAGLDKMYEEKGEIGQFRISDVESQMSAWAEEEELAGIGSTYVESDEPIMAYNARRNWYEVSRQYPQWHLYHYIHEFTHYWLLSAFALGYDECKPSVISPLTGHGPVFAKAFIMFLALHHPAKISEDDLEQSAQAAGVAVAKISSSELRQLWKEWKSANFEFDNEHSRDLISRTANFDRIEITGARAK
jgi:hypothetical protein